MTVKDLMTYSWEKPLFGMIRGIYVRPGSRIYTRTYKPGDKNRRVLFPEDVLDEISIWKGSSGLTSLLNSAFKMLQVSGAEVKILDLEDMDYRLRNDNGTKVKEFFRKRGEEHCKRISSIIPDDFNKAYRMLMAFYDIILGARYQDVESPEPGFASYFYLPGEYPLEEGTPSEMGVCSFSQGAATALHSDKETRREMRARVSRKEEGIYVLSRPDFGPEELESSF